MNTNLKDFAWRRSGQASSWASVLPKTGCRLYKDFSFLSQDFKLLPKLFDLLFLRRQGHSALTWEGQ